MSVVDLKTGTARPIDTRGPAETRTINVRKAPAGAKNAALPCMAAALLTDEPVILENIPQVRDIETTRKLLSAMGAEVELGFGRAQHRCPRHGSRSRCFRNGKAANTAFRAAH